jgi:intracellular septation protein
VTQTSTAKWVQPVVDYTGLGLFVLAFVIWRDLLAASWGLAVGSAVGLAVGFAIQRKLAWMPLVTGASAIFFATLTLIFHDSFFIKIKLTVVDSIFAALLLGGVAMGKRPLKALLGAAIKMSDAAWRTLTIRYGLFCVFLAAANAIIALNPAIFSDAVWVAFRFPGVPIVTVLFSLAQTPFLMREMKDEEAASELPPPPAS